MPRSFKELMSSFEDLKQERSVFEPDWRSVSDLIIPGRGVLQTYAKSRARKTVPNTINTIAEDALQVLASGMHAGLTSPSRPWFNLEWQDKKLNDIWPLKLWMQHASKRLHTLLHESNFYPIINSFYIEDCAFGNGCFYVGEDSEESAFRFELLTVGEYFIQRDHLGQLDTFYRLLFRSARQVVAEFGSKAPVALRNKVKEGAAGIDIIDITLLECIYKSKFMKKDYTRDVYVYSLNTRLAESQEAPLRREGFFENPIITSRWDSIGSDQYGIGPGAKVIPDVRRLQEMERSLLMGVHKQIDPPTIAPAKLRGSLNTLPGGENFTMGSNLDSVRSLYDVRFEHRGVEATIARIEQRIQRKFYNDLWLTAARDPNASPYKAAEVIARDQEKMFRLGPIIERLQFEVFYPLLQRCFNIATRKNLFEPIPNKLAQLVDGGYKISIISPLAAAQRGVALQGINTFLTGVGQIAQFDQSALDRIDTDAVIDQYADISGAPLEIIRPLADAKVIRENRQKMMQAEKDKVDQAGAAQMGSAISAEQAGAMKDRAIAGSTMVEAQQMASGAPQ
jgi:hypothetical protein